MDNKGESGSSQTKGRHEGRRLASSGGSWGQSLGLGGGGGQQTKNVSLLRVPFVFGTAVKKPKLETSSSCVCLWATLKPSKGERLRWGAGGTCPCGDQPRIEGPACLTEGRCF